MKNDEELENIYVTFLAMGFLKTTIIVSGDDGFVSIRLYSYNYSSICGRMKELLGGCLLTKAQYLQSIPILKSVLLSQEEWRAMLSFGDSSKASFLC